MVSAEDWGVYRTLKDKFNNNEMQNNKFSLSVSISLHAQNEVEKALSKERMINIVEELEVYNLAKIQNLRQLIEMVTKDKQ